MITPAILKLARAIVEHEGWSPQNSLQNVQTMPSVSYRNHNGGNLRASPFALGTRDGFAFFVDDNTGFFALVWDLWKKCNGQTSTGLTGESLLCDLIAKYAPPAENDTQAYIQAVGKATGFLPTKPLKEFVTY